MASSAQEVFANQVHDLPLAERLRLASLILQEATQPGTAIVEQSESWSGQDEQEVAAFAGLRSRLYPKAEDLV